MDFIHGEPVSTCDVRLASALLGMGIYPSGGKKATIKILGADGRAPKREIMLEGGSRCGKYKTKDLIGYWRQGLAWVENNDEHPFAYVMAAMMNHRDMLDGIRNEAEFAFLKKGRSVAMLPMDASLKLEEEILGDF